MELLFLFAHTPDEDALVLLMLAIPAFVLIMYALWIGMGRDYQPSPTCDDWEAIDEEE